MVFSKISHWFWIFGEGRTAPLNFPVAMQNGLHRHTHIQTHTLVRQCVVQRMVVSTCQFLARVAPGLHRLLQYGFDCAGRLMLVLGIQVC